MEDDSKTNGLIKIGLGAVGLGAVATAVAVPKYGIWIALIILTLALLLFGGYFLWQRSRARRKRELFTSAIEAQTAAAPTAISDPNKRASLDKVRQKFQTGLQEFKSRGKDIYKLPWYAIIGESGSGKTEAIRHSGIDFPPGMQDELQGSGGTVNMDWWFTNRGIILDTAGSMLFSEARAGETPEWREFLRLLKKARPHCPLNGLFLVLSVESLIRDSSEKIAQKASVLAQQLDLIQKTLDVRFPVYLLVTKCDLLIGFREFFENLEDPLLQHQIFGWSNPDPLDSAFRPDLVEQHLKSIAERVRRRRLALLRDAGAAGRLGDTQQFFSPTYQLGRGAPVGRRLDEVDSMYALPESVMRLAPRLRRYLETIFVAGEWSAKPVFLRGIYFTSSMREGKALDEAIALATGLSLDQLPESHAWDKNKALFLRDLFHEKVFRESGLVTRATNTMKLLRQRQALIFGSAGAALLILLTFAGFSYRNLKRSVLSEAAYWRAGATNWNAGMWSPPIVSSSGSEDALHFSYTGTNIVEGTGKSVIEYQRGLQEIVEKGLSVGWIFRPVSWMSKVGKRPEAQALLFEGGILRPLIFDTRNRMEHRAVDSPAVLPRHQKALSALIQLEADGLSGGLKGGVLAQTNAPEKSDKYLSAFLSYLTDSDQKPDTNLVEVFAWTYSRRQNAAGIWPPPTLLGGTHLSNNLAIATGLKNLSLANHAAELQINHELQLANDVVAALGTYSHLETTGWLTKAPKDPCLFLESDLSPAWQSADRSLSLLAAATNYTSAPVTSLAARYRILGEAARNASDSLLKDILSGLPEAYKSSGIILEISDQTRHMVSESARTVQDSYNKNKDAIAGLDSKYLEPPPGARLPAYALRYSLYTQACDLAKAPISADENSIGDQWKRFGKLKDLADRYRASLTAYNGVMTNSVSEVCNQIAGDAEQRLRSKFVDSYLAVVADKLPLLINQPTWTTAGVTNVHLWFDRIQADLNAGQGLVPDDKLTALRGQLRTAREGALKGIQNDLRRTIGFPVVLNSTRTMNPADLRKTGLLLDGLSREWQSPVWSGESDVFSSVKRDSDLYASVVSSLLTEDGSPAHWEIYFVPPDQADAKDTDIISVFRSVQVTIGSKASDWIELTRTTGQPLAEGAVDGGLHIAFRRLQNDPASESSKVDDADWGLVRLIQSPAFNADRRNGGATWRFQIMLEDKNLKMSGNATFEARLKKPLPALKDWPRQ
jgi:ImcF (intracellular multiplication and macrophage-killing)-related protein